MLVTAIIMEPKNVYEMLLSFNNSWLMALHNIYESSIYSDDYETEDNSKLHRYRF